MGDPRVLGGIAFAGSALAGVIVMTVRRSEALVPALLALLPLMLPAALAWFQGHLSFAGRLVYLPAGGVAWLLSLAGSGAVRRWPAWRTPIVVGVVSWLAASAWVSAQLLPSWRNDLSMYGALIRSQPENARGRVGYANQLSAAGRETEALAELDQAETIAPRMPELHVSRAVIHFRHGRWDRVLQSAERALALDPHQPQAQLLHATALLRLRRLDEAQVVLERLLEERPGEPGIEGIWGQLLLVRGEVSAAIPFLQRAAQWNTDDASVSYALGVACDAVGRWAEAQAAFARTVEIDPRYYDGWLRLARAAHAAGDRAARDRALEVARRLPEASDGRVEALTRAWQAP
jgi:predicted Zn-dependent protease